MEFSYTRSQRKHFLFIPVLHPSSLSHHCFAAGISLLSRLIRFPPLLLESPRSRMASQPHFFDMDVAKAAISPLSTVAEPNSNGNTNGQHAPHHHAPAAGPRLVVIAGTSTYFSRARKCFELVLVFQRCFPLFYKSTKKHVLGPAGSGKSTLIQRLLAELGKDKIGFSISHTTRPPRSEEQVNKQNYTTRNV